AKAQALNEFVGSPRVIREVKALLSRRDRLDDRTARQLEKVRLRAAEAPRTIPEVVRARTEADARQAATHDALPYTPRREGKPDQTLSANDIDRLLLESRDLDERRAVWEASKAIGGPLRDGLLRLRELRNKVAREMGFDSFFALQVADYGMTVPQMIALTDGFLEATRPLYEQLHTWAKHLLARRYGADPAEGKIPAHWLPNRGGKDWPGLIEGVDMDGPFRGKPKSYVAEQAERFYIALGFPRLPASFWSKSDLYPANPLVGRKK